VLIPCRDVVDLLGRAAARFTVISGQNLKATLQRLPFELGQGLPKAEQLSRWLWQAIDQVSDVAGRELVDKQFMRQNLTLPRLSEDFREEHILAASFDIRDGGPRAIAERGGKRLRLNPLRFAELSNSRPEGFPSGLNIPGLRNQRPFPERSVGM
jgi:hypothetical protein